MAQVRFDEPHPPQPIRWRREVETDQLPGLALPVEFASEVGPQLARHAGDEYSPSQKCTPKSERRRLLDPPYAPAPAVATGIADNPEWL
jgi:hypothetical protein